jgi:hypothetical protein
MPKDLSLDNLHQASCVRKDGVRNEVLRTTGVHPPGGVNRFLGRINAM